jgi:hypothetical protein
MITVAFIAFSLVLLRVVDCTGQASILWSTNTGAQNSGDGLATSPVLSNGDNTVIYTFGSTNSALSIQALSAQTGANLWTWQSDVSSTNIFGVSGMTQGDLGLYFAASSTACSNATSATSVCVYALGYDGYPRWRTPIDTQVQSPTVTSIVELDGVAVLGAGSTLYGLDAVSGTVLSLYSSGLSGLFSSFDSSIVHTSSALYFVSQCSVYAVTRNFQSKAAVLWNKDIPLYSGGCSCQHIEIAPKLGLGYILNANNEVSQILAMELDTGAFVFTINGTFNSGTGQVTYVDSLQAIAFAGTGNAPTMTLANATSGDVLWRTPAFKSSNTVNFGVITARDGWVYTASTDGQTWANMLAYNGAGEQVFLLNFPSVSSNTGISRAYFSGDVVVYVYGPSLFGVNSGQAYTPVPSVPSPITLVTYSGSLYCSGDSVDSKLPVMCQYGATTSVLRFCTSSRSAAAAVAPTLTVQFFNASDSCTGVPERVSQYVVGRCYIDETLGSSFEIASC